MQTEPTHKLSISYFNILFCGYIFYHVYYCMLVRYVLGTVEWTSSQPLGN